MGRIGPLALAAVAPAFLAITFLVGSTPDEEELRWGILSTFLHVRALAQGSVGTWTSVLGFGMPQPMVPNFDLHPLAPLLLVVSPVTWTRWLLVTHTVLGAAGMWQLTRSLALTPFVRAVCVWTFCLATPTQNYVLSDFWPSHYVMWTSAPWLLLIVRRVLDADAAQVRRWGALLGVVGGLVLAATHPGHAPVYATVCLAVLAAEWRAVAARWPWLLAAALIALAIASPNLLQLAAQRTAFSPELGVVKLPDPLPPGAWRDVFLRPFSASEHPWQIELLNRGARTLFFGGPFAVLGLAGLVRFGRSHAWLAIGGALSTVLLFTPVLPLTFVSRFHFRDPLLVCAIPLAGVVADFLLGRPRVRPLAITLLLAQVGLVATGALPFLDGAQGRAAVQARWFRGAVGDAAPMDALVALMPAAGRLAYSPQIDVEVSERMRLSDGLGVNAPAYRGLSIVNGSFKGVSSDVLWSDDRLFYGRVRLPRQLVTSDDGLDLLGIRYLLANPGEEVAAGLRERGRIRKSTGQPAVLYENPDASPGAVVVDGPPADLPALPLYADCINERLLCRDLAPLARLRRAEPVAITRAGPRIDVGVAAAPAPRTLVLAEMFRPGWTAASGGVRLDTVSVGPGLLGVGLPGGVSTVELVYHAPLQVAASVVAWMALAAGIAAVFPWRARRAAPHERPSRASRSAD